MDLFQTPMPPFFFVTYIISEKLGFCFYFQGFPGFPDVSSIPPKDVWSHKSAINVQCKKFVAGAGLKYKMSSG